MKMTKRLFGVFDFCKFSILLRKLKIVKIGNRGNSSSTSWPPSWLNQKWNVSILVLRNVPLFQISISFLLLYLPCLTANPGGRPGPKSRPRRAPLKRSNTAAQAKSAVTTSPPELQRSWGWTDSVGRRARAYQF